MIDLNEPSLNEYIKLKRKKQTKGIDEFSKRVEAGNQKLLDLILNKTDSEVEDFITDKISNLFEINCKFDRGRGFIHYAVIRGSRGVLRAVLNNGGLVNLKDVEGKTALHDAIIRGYFPLVKILIEYGADINAKDDYDRTPLHYCALCCK